MDIIEKVLSDLKFFIVTVTDKEHTISDYLFFHAENQQWQVYNIYFSSKK